MGESKRKTELSALAPEREEARRRLGSLLLQDMKEAAESEHLTQADVYTSLALAVAYAIISHKQHGEQRLADLDQFAAVVEAMMAKAPTA